MNAILDYTVDALSTTLDSNLGGSFGGAVDIVVVKQEDGSFKSSPFYVRFGKFMGAMPRRERVVKVLVNGTPTDFTMHLSSSGEAYFRAEEVVTTATQAVALLKPEASATEVNDQDASSVAGEAKGAGEGEELLDTAASALTPSAAAPPSPAPAPAAPPPTPTTATATAASSAASAATAASVAPAAAGDHSSTSGTTTTTTTTTSRASDEPGPAAAASAEAARPLLLAPAGSSGASSALENGEAAPRGGSAPQARTAQEHAREICEDLSNSAHKLASPERRGPRSDHGNGLPVVGTSALRTADQALHEAADDALCAPPAKDDAADEHADLSAKKGQLGQQLAGGAATAGDDSSRATAQQLDRDAAAPATVGTRPQRSGTAAASLPTTYTLGQSTSLEELANEELVAAAAASAAGLPQEEAVDDADVLPQGFPKAPSSPFTETDLSEASELGGESEYDASVYSSGSERETSARAPTLLARKKPPRAQHAHHAHHHQHAAMLRSGSHEKYYQHHSYRMQASTPPSPYSLGSSPSDVTSGPSSLPKTFVGEGLRMLTSTASADSLEARALIDSAAEARDPLEAERLLGSRQESYEGDHTSSVMGEMTFNDWTSESERELELPIPVVHPGSRRQTRAESALREDVPAARDNGHIRPPESDGSGRRGNGVDGAEDVDSTPPPLRPAEQTTPALATASGAAATQPSTVLDSTDAEQGLAVTEALDTVGGTLQPKSSPLRDMRSRSEYYYSASDLPALDAILAASTTPPTRTEEPIAESDEASAHALRDGAAPVKGVPPQGQREVMRSVAALLRNTSTVEAGPSNQPAAEAHNATTTDSAAAALPSEPRMPSGCGGLNRLELSLCASGLLQLEKDHAQALLSGSKGTLEQMQMALFDENLMTLDKLREEPSIASSPELVCRLEGRIMEWKALAPVVLGWLAFGYLESIDEPQETDAISSALPNAFQCLSERERQERSAAIEGASCESGLERQGSDVIDIVTEPIREDAAVRDSQPAGAPATPSSLWRLWPFASSKTPEVSGPGASAGTPGDGEQVAISIDSKEDAQHAEAEAAQAAGESGANLAPVQGAQETAAVGNSTTATAEDGGDSPTAEKGASEPGDASLATTPRRNSLTEAEELALATALANSNATHMGRLSSQRSHRTRRRKMNRVYLPPADKLQALPLREGRNLITFQCESSVWGTQTVQGYLYMWPWNCRIVISDVDGTITKSDLLGQILPAFGKDWSQPGVTALLDGIQENGYRLLYLSARSLAQAGLTRGLLKSIEQEGVHLPDGPISLSPDGLIPALYREVIVRRPQDFKIACLQDVKSLFPVHWNPFYAGFGNRETDQLAYAAVGVPPKRIFTINPKGEVRVGLSSDAMSLTQSYTTMRELVNEVFPPLDKQAENEIGARDDFDSFLFWRAQPDLQLISDDEDA